MRRGHIIRSRNKWDRDDNGLAVAEFEFDISGLDQVEASELHREVELLIKEKLTA